jgi:hypothetical protein
MPVTLSDEEWAQFNALLLATTNAFATATSAFGVIANAAEQMAAMAERKNNELRASQPRNRAERRAAIRR